MNCRELLPFWPMFLDGELGADDAAPYLSHLEACTNCNAFVRGEQQFRRVFRDKVLARGQNREALPLAVRERLEALAKGKRSSSWRVALASVAMGVAIALTFTTQSAFTPVLANVAEKHRAALPLDVATNEPREAQQFVEAHVPALRLPRFKSADVHLTGARLVDFPGHRGAMVRYTVGKSAQPVSIAVYRADGRESVNLREVAWVGQHRVFTDRVGDLEAAVWQSQDMIYSMVGNLDRAGLLQVISEIEN